MNKRKKKVLRLRCTRCDKITMHTNDGTKWKDGALVCGKRFGAFPCWGSFELDVEEESKEDK